jgi:hypothetical protein
VLAKAAEIAEQQKARVRDGGEFLDGKEIMRLLQASVKTKPRVAELKQYKNGSGVVVVQVDKDNAKEMKVTINRGKNISSGDVRAALGELINELP